MITTEYNDIEYTYLLRTTEGKEYVQSDLYEVLYFSLNEIESELWEMLHTNEIHNYINNREIWLIIEAINKELSKNSEYAKIKYIKETEVKSTEYEYEEF